MPITSIRWQQYTIIAFSYTIIMAFSHLAAAGSIPKASYSQALSLEAGSNEKNVTSKKPSALSRSVRFSVETSHGTATGTQDIVLLPFPSASSAGATSGNAYTYVNGYSILTYYFEVIGPKADSVPVVVTVSGSLNSTTNGGSFAQASITYHGRQLGEVQYGCGYGAPVEICGAYSTPIAVAVTPSQHPNAGNAAEIQIESVDAIYEGGAGGSIAASITIDPSFSGSGAYSIITSAGIGNSSTMVPSPR